MAGKFQNGPGLDLPLLQFSLGRNNTPTKTKKSFSLALFQVLASSPTRPREKKSSKPHTGEWKSWKASHDGRPKLNTGKPGPAGAGGLIRDAPRRFMMGFAAGIGCCNALKAELWP